MIKSKIVLLSALVSCALISGCKEENKTNVSIEFMHSSVEQERQAVISKLIARFEKENPGITVKQVPVEEDAYNTKVITLSRSGSLPEVIETSHDYAKGKRTARAVLTGMCYSAGSAMRHGSSSLTRLTGQSAMTPSTWRR